MWYVKRLLNSELIVLFQIFAVVGSSTAYKQVVFSKDLFLC